MELETLFTEQKWNILSLLAEDDYSPLQLSEKMNSTISNVSQALKLLEAAGLVKKKKISNRDKGKPRILFSLANESAYIVTMTNGFASKKLVITTTYHKAILKIWSIENTSLHAGLTLAYMQAMPKLSEFDAIYISKMPTGLNLTFVTDGSKEVTKIILALASNPMLTLNGIKITSLKPESFKKKQADELSSLIFLHDSITHLGKNLILSSKLANSAKAEVGLV